MLIKKLLLTIITIGVIFGATAVLAPAPVYADSHCNADTLNAGNCDIIKHLTTFIRVLSVSVGVVVVIMVAWGGFQYVTSADNPQQAASAKEHIRNAIIALVFYIFSIAFLNYLVPGGLV